MGIIKNNKNIIAIYRGDKKITSVLKNEKIIFSLKKDNYILSTITTTTENEEIKLFNNKIFFKSVVINDSINVDINSTTSYTFTTPGTYTIKYNLDETKTWFNSMFNGCFTLTSFDFTKAQTSQITDINSLFGNCYKLSDLDISTFDTSSVIKMSGTFQGCTSLTSLDLAHFNTSKVTDMSRLFSQCTALERLDLSNFDISLVTSFNYMFYNCNKLKYIRCKQAFYDWCITNQDAINLPTAMREGGDGTWDIIDAPKNLIKASFTTTSENKRVKITSRKQYFDSIKLENNTELITSGNGSLKYTFPTSGIHIITYKVKNGITDINNMFNGCGDIIEIDASKLDTSKVTNMNNVFDNCSSLSKLDISTWDTSQVTQINGMFGSCSSMIELNLSNFNTENLTSVVYTFYGCSNLEYLDVSGWNVEKLTNFNSQFRFCDKLNHIKCTHSFKDWCITNQNTINLPASMREGGSGTWDMYSNAKTTFALGITLLTSKKEYFSSIKNVSKDEELDVSGNGELSISAIGYMYIKYTFKEGLTDLISCFANCSKLDSIDLSDVSFASINDISGLFEGCSSITKISFKDEDLSHISNYTNAFANCKLLKSIVCSESTMNWIKEHSTEMGLNDTMINGTIGKYGGKTNWELYYEPTQPGESGQSLKIWSDYSGDYIKITNSQEKFNSITVDGMPLDVSGYGELRFNAQRDGEIIADFSLKTDQINYDGLFERCDKIMEVDLSGFDFSMALNCDYMFRDCNRLQKVYFPDNIERLESLSFDIFTRCDELQTIRCTRRMKDWFFEDPDRFQLPDNLRYGSEGPVDSGSNWELYDY